MMTDHYTSRTNASGGEVVPSLHVRIVAFDQGEPAFTIASNYLEMFWQSVLGPTSTAFVRYIARCELSNESETATSYTPLDAYSLCVALGIHKKGGQVELPRAFAQTVERLAQLKFVVIDQRDEGRPSHISIRSHVSLVPARTRKQWPPLLRDRHDRFVASAVTAEPHDDAR